MEVEALATDGDHGGEMSALARECSALIAELPSEHADALAAAVTDHACPHSCRSGTVSGHIFRIPPASKGFVGALVL